ncbi:hypothetical protein ACFY2E_47190 [Nonomuraea jabiensis]|uniref:hypothetical protein n=1 Tax=Nonomuraea jabiensis TaxID=882448 RepID=UPI0036D0BDAB
MTADEAYGQDYKFRVFLEQHRIGYVVAVPRSQAISGGLGPRARAESLVAEVPASAWKRLSAGQGAKGARLYDWAMATLPIIREPEEGPCPDEVGADRPYPCANGQSTQPS